MPKRKRDFDTESPPPSQSPACRALSTLTPSLTTTVTQGTSSLKKALNLARGFERQKLGRRQKAATNEPQTLLKLREEVIVLKGLDLSVVAERQLLRRLGRVKRVKESGAWVAGYAGRGVEGAKGEAEARVVGRLMGSKAVRECADGVVGRVMDVLGLEKVVVGKEKRVNERDVKGGEADFGYARASELTRGKDDEWSGSESEAEDEMDLDDNIDPGNCIKPQNLAHHETDGSDVDMDDSSVFSGFSVRIASSSADSAASNSDSDVSEEQSLTGRTKPETRQSPNLTIQTSPSPSPKPKTKTKATRKLSPRPPSSTAFLPSLRMGGYYSGSSSGSDISDINNKPRKNRRGQRARQKIAEAKFGAGAKHVAKQKQEQNGGRNAGWDPKRGATDGKVNTKGRVRIGRPDNVKTAAKSKGLTGANGDNLGSRKRELVKEGPMHPSWEAARKRKEQGSKISIDTGGKGIGRKITFD